MQCGPHSKPSIDFLSSAGQSGAAFTNTQPVSRNYILQTQITNIIIGFNLFVPEAFLKNLGIPSRETLKFIQINFFILNSSSRRSSAAVVGFFFFFFCFDEKLNLSNTSSFTALLAGKSVWEIIFSSNANLVASISHIWLTLFEMKLFFNNYALM